jgi:hypothetical protein
VSGTANPAPSPRVAAAEAEIAETRRRLDAALAAARRDLAVPIAAATVAAAALGRVGGAAELAPLIRRHAAAFGLMALGAAWLAMQYRGALGEAGGAYARDVFDRIRTIGGHAVEAALDAVLETPPAASGGDAPPDDRTAAERAATARSGVDDT